MGRSRHPPDDDHDPRHARAVANSLRLAGEAAARGDYADAVAWVDTVTAIGEPLSPDVQKDRLAWLREMSVEQASAREVGERRSRRMAE